jgi:D-sedoheptulose 7-phosphate isomerase
MVRFRAMSENQNTDFLSAYRKRTIEVLESVDVDAVSRAVDMIFAAWRRRALVVIAGNGGSAATASHCANDLSKATRVAGQLPMRAVSITDNAALMTALANDDGFETIFSHQMETLFRPGDVLIAISASGNSPNILHAARHAVQTGGEVISFTGFTGGELPSYSDVQIHVESEKGEYGPVEDAHMILVHMLTGALFEKIAAAPVAAAENGSAS